MRTKLLSNTQGTLKPYSCIDLATLSIAFLLLRGLFLYGLIFSIATYTISILFVSFIFISPYYLFSPLQAVIILYYNNTTCKGAFRYLFVILFFILIICKRFNKLKQIILVIIAYKQIYEFVLIKRLYFLLTQTTLQSNFS